MTPPGKHVFISYSRADEWIVTPIVQMIRAIGVSAFQDIDSICYGERWRPIIDESIANADIVLVFWCKHSCESNEVRKEWEQAIRHQRMVVPTLLDDTPLERQLAEYHGIDLRKLIPGHALELHAIPGQRAGTELAISAAQRILSYFEEMEDRAKS